MGVGNALYEANPTLVVLDENSEPKLKAILAFHSYTIGLHSRMVGSVVQDWLSTSNVDMQGGYNEGTSTLKWVSTSPITRTIDEKSALGNEENMLKKKIVERVRCLITSLELSSEERILLTLGGFLHDEGKWIEPEQKAMVNLRKDVHGQDISGIKMYGLKKKANGKAEKLTSIFAAKFVDTAELEEISNNPILSLALDEGVTVDHTQDALTIYIYRRLEKDGLLTAEERKQLEEIHRFFTYISANRYGLTPAKVDGMKAVLTKHHADRAFKKGLILAVADEIGKGPYFYDVTLSAKNEEERAVLLKQKQEEEQNRIEKLTNLLTLLESFGN